MKIIEKVYVIDKPIDGNSSSVEIYPTNNNVDIAIHKNVINDDDDDDDDDGEQQNVRDKEVVLGARRKWALIHFYTLRPAFSFSLLLYITSLTSGRGVLTFRSGVVDPIRNLASLVQMESNTYTASVQQSTTRTAQRLEKLAGEHREKMEGLFDSNRETIQRAEETASDCLRDTQKARGSLVQWREDGMDIPWMEIMEADGGAVIQNTSALLSSLNSTCTVQKRNQTERLLGQDYRLAEDQVNTALDNYMSDSHNSMEVIHGYAMDRFDYDWNYFIMERIQPALDYLVEHSVSIQTMGIDLDYNVTEIEHMILEQLQVLQRELEQAKQHIDLLQKKLVEFRTSIHGFYVRYNDMYDRMHKAAKIMFGFLPPGISLPDVFDFSDIPVADYFLPPSGLNWPEIELEYGDIQRKVQDTAEACLKIVIQLLDDAQIQAVQGLRGVVQQFSQELMEILELKNYDPPQFKGSRDGIFDIDQEVQFHSSRGQEALNWTTQALVDLRVRSPTLGNLTISEVEIPEVDTFDYNFTEDTSTTFKLLTIIIPKLSFIEYVLDKIALLDGYAFVLDILFGFFQWWRLLSIYEKGAMPNMPEIDYGDGDQHARERPQTIYKMLFFIMKSFMNPVFVGFLSIFSFVTFLVIVIWIPHVQQMCIHSSNGTWFANNMLAPTLTNIAMAEGNAQYKLAEQSCFSSQNQWCTKIGMEVEKQVLFDKTSLHSFQTQHNRSLEALELMEDCVDTSSMTKMVTKSCCGLKGYNSVDCFSSSNYVCPIDSSTSPPSAYRPVATYLNSSACLEQLHEWTLMEEKYECTSLREACYHIPCQGVNDEWIHKYTTETDCKAELWIIESCRFWCALIFHFIALYVICSLIYLGCRDVHWREISPDSIKLRTNLRENGELAKGNELQERLEQILNEIQWFERNARLQIFIGVFLLVGYIITVLVFIFSSS